MSNTNCGCLDPCQNKCECETLTTEDIEYVGANDECVGLLRGSRLTTVLDQIRTFLKNRLYNVISDNLLITYPETTCDRTAIIEVVPSTDDGNIFTLGTDGYPYVPNTNSGSDGTVLTEDTNSVNITGNGALGTELSADVILDPKTTQLTKETSQGLLTEDTFIQDLQNNLVQHIELEIPVLNRTTYSVGVGTEDGLKVVLLDDQGGVKNYATDYTTTNNVKVFWGDTTTFENTLDNEAGADKSLSHTYAALRPEVTNAFIKTYNTAYITDLGYSPTVIPSGFKAIKGGSLLKTISFGGLEAGTTGTYDFKGLYNLESFNLGVTDNNTYNTFIASKNYINTEDLHSITSFTNYGNVNNSNITLHNAALDNVFFNFTKTVNKFSAKYVTNLAFQTNASKFNILDFEETNFRTLSLFNCGWLFNGGINKIILKLTEELPQYPSIVQGTGIFDFSSLYSLSVVQINGISEGSVEGIIPTQVLIPDFANDGELKYVDINQDWIKDEVILSLDNNGLLNGQLLLQESDRTLSFGENFNDAYYNPIWAPLNGGPAAIAVNRNNTVDSVDVSYAGLKYGTVPVIFQAGPGSGATFEVIMDLAAALSYGTNITTPGTGYIVGNLYTMTAVGSTIAPVIEVVSVDGFGGVTDYLFNNLGEFTSLPTSISHAGGLQIDTTNNFSVKKINVLTPGSGYNNSSIFKLEVTSGGGAGTGTASTAAKTALLSLHDKGWGLKF